MAAARRSEAGGMNQIPPHDLEAEAAVLGAVLVSPRILDDLAGFMVPGDFYRPAHQHIFATLIDLRAGGVEIDVISVATELREQKILEDIGGTDALLELQASTGSLRAAGHHARTVVDCALRRRAIAVAADISAEAYENPDPAAVVDTANQLVSSLALPVPDRPPHDLHDLVAFLDRPSDDIEGGAWAVPGVLRRSWRAVFVAGEGIGKSMILKQIAMLPAQGIHPFAFTTIPPVTTLIVDAENPYEVIDHQAGLILPRLVQDSDVKSGRCWLWTRPQGIDVRSRSGRAELEAAIAHVRPALVCLGPLYKCFQTGANENYELVAQEVQHVFDELRVRYHFALVLEHHAPKSAASKRSLVPAGASVWLRWSEFGFTLTPTDDFASAVKLGRFRLDRIPAMWPEKLTRSTRGYPWEASWPTGTWTHPVTDEGEPF